MASLESQTIRDVCKGVFICEFQQDTPGIWPGGVEQLRKQEVPSCRGFVPGVRRVDAFVNLVVFRLDEGVGVSDKLSKEASALRRVLDLERDGTPIAKERSEYLDRPIG